MQKQLNLLFGNILHVQYHKFKMNQYYREKKEKNGKYKNELNR